MYLEDSGSWIYVYCSPGIIPEPDDGRGGVKLPFSELDFFGNDESLKIL